MSFFKAAWWRPASALVVLALVVAAMSVGGRGSALAGTVGDGSITVNPQPELDIGAGGSGQINVDMTPAAAGTSIWIIKVAYDPTIAQVAMSGGEPVCTGLDTSVALPGSAGLASCDIKDTDSDSVPDTLVIFGGVVKNDGGTAVGLTTPQTLATFTFDAVGASGTQTDLTVSVAPTDFLGPDGSEATPALTNGAIHITTPVGTSRIWGDVNCSGTFTGGDAINVDRFLVSLPRTPTPPADCPAMDATVTINGGTWQFADVNCSGTLTGGDAVNIDRALVSLPVTPAPPANCPVMGTTYTVS